MAVKPDPIAEEDAYPTGVYAPDVGTLCRAEDVEIGLASLAFRTNNLKLHKYDKTGGTVSGNVEITGSLDVDTNANVDGTLTVAGAASFVSEVTISSNVPLRLTGAQPTPQSDPGANNRVYAAQICKAWGFIEIAAGVETIKDGFNVLSAAIPGGDHREIEITFARAMASTDYHVECSLRAQNGGSGGIRMGLIAYPADGTFATTKFAIRVVDVFGTGANAEDLTSGTYRISFAVYARQ